MYLLSMPAVPLIFFSSEGDMKDQRIRSDICPRDYSFARRYPEGLTKSPNGFWTPVNFWRVYLVGFALVVVCLLYV